ncbi:MAG: heme-binding protein [Pseudomonadota bacterium]
MTRLKSPRRAVLALMTGALLAGCSVLGAPAAEEPPFTLISEEGDFEIREYPAIAVVQTTVTEADRDEATGIGFRRLFRYISGGNVPVGGGDGAEIAMTAPVIVDDAASGEEIAMTAPVLVSPESEGSGAAEGAEIAMTAPVLVDPSGEGQGEGWTIVFVLPDDMTADTAPRPTDPTVEISTIAPRRVAVYRFAGFLSEGNVADGEAALAGWMSSKGLSHRGDWTSAGYNPPWTLPWMRRNEVMVTLEP